MSGGRPVGSGTYSRLEWQRLAIGKAAELWQQRGRAPTLEAVAGALGYSRRGMGRALRRNNLHWVDIWNAAGRQSSSGGLWSHTGS